MSDSDLIGTGEAAEILRVSVRTVHRRAASGELPYARRGHGPNGFYVFSRQVVEQIAGKRRAPVEQ